MLHALVWSTNKLDVVKVLYFDDDGFPATASLSPSSHVIHQHATSREIVSSILTVLARKRQLAALAPHHTANKVFGSRVKDFQKLCGHSAIFVVVDAANSPVSCLAGTLKTQNRRDKCIGRSIPLSILFALF
jgi:hypothetical protein